MGEHEKRLREALEAGPTPGPWRQGVNTPGRVYPGYPSLEPVCKTYADANARYIAAANPEAIRALLSDLDAARSESARLAGERAVLAGLLGQFVAALDGKRAANEAGQPGFEFNDLLWSLLEPARAALGPADIDAQAAGGR